jgi:hypothetical protein
MHCVELMIFAHAGISVDLERCQAIRALIQIKRRNGD